MAASAIREILHAASSPGVTSLAGGLPADDSFPPAIMDDLMTTVLRRYGGRALQYDASEGFEPLREALVPHLAARGVTTTAEGLVVFTGSQGVLDALGKVLVSPGDTVAVEAPTYLGALQAFNPYEPRYAEVATDDDGLIQEALDAILARTRVKFVYLVPTFQNPTGRTLSLARRRQVAEILQRRDTLLVEGDPYSDLRYTGDPLPPIYSFAPEHVVYISTLSKTFAPGLRLGFCVAPEALRRWIVIARQGVDLHTSTLGQALAAEYISGGHLERHLPEGFRWTWSEGGMFVWVQGPAGLDAEALNRLVMARGVAFVPGKYFFVNQEDGVSTLRMNFTAADPAAIDRAVGIIGDTISEDGSPRR